MDADERAGDDRRDDDLIDNSASGQRACTGTDDTGCAKHHSASIAKHWRHADAAIS